MHPIIFLQIILYLFISPIVAYIIGANGELSLAISTVFLLTYVLSYKWHMRGNRMVSCNDLVSEVRINRWFVYLISCFTLIYLIEIIRFDLMDRRIGSENIANLFSSLSFYDLLAIRVYEVILYPLLAVTVYSMRSLSKHNDRQSVLLLFGMLVIGFLFSGLVDSRGKLLVPLVYFFVLFIWPTSRKFHLSRFQVFVLVIVATFGVIISYNRYSAYGDFIEFMLVEFVSRTDGLFLIESLAEHENIGFFGTFDFYSLKYYLTLVPFLEMAGELKALGLTSSKGYYIKDLLGFNAMDGTISVIAEPFYLFGFLGVVVAGIIWGVVTSRFDLAARNNQIFSTRVRAAFYIAILINFIKFESEFVGILLATCRDFFIIYILFLGIKFNKTKSDAFQ